MKTVKPLKIALFTDGRPGHEKQSKGIIAQLKKMTQVEVVTCQVRKPSLWAQLAGFLNLFWGNIEPSRAISDCDILIGTGTHTHLPMLVAKRRYGMVVVTCMTPGKLLQSRFDLIIAPFHDNPDAERENIISTIGPPNENQNLGQHSLDKVLILVGGSDPKYLRWDQEKIRSSIQSLILADPQKNYVISSSPRTPDSTEVMLEDMVKTYKNAHFYRFENTEKGWIEIQYSKCKTVWVTGDSVSMVYEALSSGCRVGIIPVDWLKRSSKFSRSENHLREKGLVLDIAEYLNGDSENIANFNLQEAKRCAEEILRRFG